MDVNRRNTLFLQGIIEYPGLFPQLEHMERVAVQFDPDFGLASLPIEPGLILIRGARQIGKSTWLEQEIKKSIEALGKGSTIYLNGDEVLNANALVEQIRTYLPLFSRDVTFPRIFIDEITAIPNWENAIKRLFDEGATRKVLIVTTGSKAVDLRRGTERLPGRKGRLARSNYLFTPVSFTQFKAKCAAHFGDDILIAFIITGGSPIAINELIQSGSIPEYVAELTRDWILGECAAQGRSRNLLIWIVRALIERGGAPVPLDKLAKEAGAANNTVIRGYIELLADLMCISTSYPVDASTGSPLPRRAQKFHWIHLLSAISFHPQRPRSIQDFKNLATEEQAKFLEWLVAQELWRRAALAGEEQPELQYFWRSDKHELDFLQGKNEWIEVKKGSASPSDFFWFPKTFPKGHLQVVSSDSMPSSDYAAGVTFEDFLTRT